MAKQAKAKKVEAPKPVKRAKVPAHVQEAQDKTLQSHAMKLAEARIARQNAVSKAAKDFK